jgi:hypothetical protein
MSYELFTDTFHEKAKSRVQFTDTLFYVLRAMTVTLPFALFLRAAIALVHVKIRRWCCNLKLALN